MVKCEYCENPIDTHNNGSFDISIHCSDWHGSHKSNFIRGEYSSSSFMQMGDMCEDCAKMILYQIEEAIRDIGFPERYESIDKDKLKETITKGKMKYGKND